VFTAFPETPAVERGRIMTSPSLRIQDLRVLENLGHEVQVFYPHPPWRIMERTTVPSLCQKPFKKKIGAMTNLFLAKELKTRAKSLSLEMAAFRTTYSPRKLRYEVP
jgi:hypothetical protein